MDTVKVQGPFRNKPGTYEEISAEIEDMYKHFRPKEIEKAREMLACNTPWQELSRTFGMMRAKYYGEADSREELKAYHRHWQSVQREAV